MATPPAAFLGTPAGPAQPRRGPATPPVPLPGTPLAVAGTLGRLVQANAAGAMPEARKTLRKQLAWEVQQWAWNSGPDGPGANRSMLIAALAETATGLDVLEGEEEEPEDPPTVTEGELDDLRDFIQAVGRLALLLDPDQACELFRALSDGLDGWEDMKIHKSDQAFLGAERVTLKGWVDAAQSGNREVTAYDLDRLVSLVNGECVRKLVQRGRESGGDDWDWARESEDEDDKGKSSTDDDSDTEDSADTPMATVDTPTPVQGASGNPFGG